MNTKKNTTIQIRCDAELKLAIEKAVREHGYDNASELARTILTQWCIDQELAKLGLSKVKA